MAGFSFGCRCQKLYSMYNSAFLDDLTKAMGRKSFDEDLKALPEKGGYLCLFDVDKFKTLTTPSVICWAMKC